MLVDKGIGDSVDSEASDSPDVELHVRNINRLIMQIAHEIGGINKDIDEMNATRDKLLATVEDLNNIALHLKGIDLLDLPDKERRHSD